MLLKPPGIFLRWLFWRLKKRLKNKCLVSNVYINGLPVLTGSLFITYAILTKNHTFFVTFLNKKLITKQLNCRDK
jgi:hypothetical protein